jgi:glycosyltransferase involved in cell wall biosynthesis
VLGRNVETAFDGIVPRHRIRIVPNGIPDYFENFTRRETGPRPLVLLFLSTLVAEKGFLDMLRALPRVMDRVGTIRAIFAGELCSQRDKEAAEELTDRFGVGAIAEFVGPVGPARKQELLEMTDVFILPSKNEGHPFAVLEAMAAGLPIVATKVGCIPETVQDGLNGFLIEPGDVEKLAEKICILLTDDVLRLKMGQASRERFRREFTFEIFQHRMRAVFAEVFNEGKPNHLPDKYERSEREGAPCLTGSPT